MVYPQLLRPFISIEKSVDWRQALSRYGGGLSNHLLESSEKISTHQNTVVGIRLLLFITDISTPAITEKSSGPSSKFPQDREFSSIQLVTWRQICLKKLH